MPDPGRRKKYVTCMVLMQKNHIEENPGNGLTIFLHKFTVFLSVFVNKLLVCMLIQPTTDKKLPIFFLFYTRGTGFGSEAWIKTHLEICCVLSHKVHMYIIHIGPQCMSRVGIGTPQPLSPQRVCPSPWNQREGGAHSPAGEGESQFQRQKKSLALCLLCCVQYGRGREEPQIFLYIYYLSMKTYICIH